ncbi:hypothetical protein, partial [Barnesiella intestinihominis]|uniref:hypothetical protein n=1 Tax=Barnesiella intestinihominis TaxID=487174 RepID=UPI003AB54E22
AGDESNMTSIKLPYIMRLAWETNTTVSTMRCHKLVAEPLVRYYAITTTKIIERFFILAVPACFQFAGMVAGNFGIGSDQRTCRFGFERRRIFF